MSRLPVVGQDDDIWGEILNDYLSVSHDNDGTLKSSAVGGAIPDGSIAAAKLAGGSVTNSKIADATISEAKLDSSVQTKLNAGGGDPVVGGDLSGTASNAQLVAGAVTGTELAAGAVTDAKVAASASIAQSKIANLTTDLSGKEAVISTGTTSQYYRGDKTWQTLDKTAVGLTNVDNTSDLNKPVSTATQTALNGKADKATLTTKGDIYAATAASAPARLGVGSDGDVLTADSSQTTGLKWSSPGSGYIQGDGIAKVTVGTTAPTGPAVGDVWIQTP